MDAEQTTEEAFDRAVLATGDNARLAEEMDAADERVTCDLCGDLTLRSQSTPLISYNEEGHRGEPVTVYRCQLCEVRTHRTRCDGCGAFYDGRTGSGFCGEGTPEDGPGPVLNWCPICTADDEAAAEMVGCSCGYFGPKEDHDGPGPHAWDQDDEPSEPDPDDWTMFDTPGGVSVGSMVGGWWKDFADRDEAEAAIKARMDEDHIWTNVWWVSDHGNAHLVRL